jgi:hypothetical protein
MAQKMAHLIRFSNPSIKGTPSEINTHILYGYNPDAADAALFRGAAKSIWWGSLR